MGPMDIKKRAPLSQLNYMVDDRERLQCFEYIIFEQPDMSYHHTFPEEFRNFIIERGLQRKLGLRIGLLDDPDGWSEFEVSEKRGSIMVPQRVGIPKFDNESSVTTEREATVLLNQRVSHTHTSAMVTTPATGTIRPSSRRQEPTFERSRTNDWFLAGNRLVVGSPLQLIVSTATSKL